MKKKVSTSGLGAEKLQHLLRLCNEYNGTEEPLDPHQKKSELLQDLLAESLEAEVPPGYFPEPLTKLCKISGIIYRDSIRTLLTSPHSDIDALKKIKEYFKCLSQRSESEIEHDVSNTIYYASIASALVFHDIKITTFSFENLRTFFARLAQEEWISKDIQQLYIKAQKSCERNA